MEVDLLCDESRVVVEIDGQQHLADADAYRRDRRKDAALQEHGYFVLRFLAEDLAKHLDDVLDAILRAVSRRRAPALHLGINTGSSSAKTDQLSSRANKKAETLVSAWEKNWRQPTLAESIKPLPSARLCLTAVFGMGTGRTTALWPPKNVGNERLACKPERNSPDH